MKDMDVDHSVAPVTHTCGGSSEGLCTLAGLGECRQLGTQDVPGFGFESLSRGVPAY